MTTTAPTTAATTATARPAPDTASTTPTTPTEQGHDDQPRVLLTVEAAAARLSISRTRMYALIKTRDVTSVRVGRLRRIPATALDEFAATLIAAQPAA